MALRTPKGMPRGTVAERGRQPMAASEVRTLLNQTATIILKGMNELEERIQALEQGRPASEHRTTSGLIVP